LDRKNSIDDQVKGALEDPPHSPIAAPILLRGVLSSIRQMLLVRGTLSSADRQSFNIARERWALTIACIDSMTREKRLLQVFAAAIEHQPTEG
jgi:hypothetical protein